MTTATKALFAAAYQAWEKYWNLYCEAELVQVKETGKRYLKTYDEVLKAFLATDDDYKEKLWILFAHLPRNMANPVESEITSAQDVVVLVVVVMVGIVLLTLFATWLGLLVDKSYIAWLLGLV